MRSRPVRFAALVGLLGAVLAVSPASAAAGLQTVSGYAYGEHVDVTTLALLRVTSGPMPEAGPLASSGGTSTNSALSTCAPIATCSILSTGTLDVHTNGS